MNNTTHSIMILDDHPIIHDALTNLLTADPNFHVSATAFSATEAFEKLEDNLPDLIIIDLSLSDSDGVYLVQRIKAQYPKLRMLVYSMSEEKLFAGRTATAGADGYVMKTSPPSVLKFALNEIIHGNFYFPDDVMEKIDKIKEGKNAGTPLLIDVLSNREMDVLTLIGQGLNTGSISDKLNLSRNTVDTHRINIKNKLDLDNGKALDRYAYEVFNLKKNPE